VNGNDTIFHNCSNRVLRMSFGQGLKTIVTDSHFLVPFCVLLAGIALLVALH
jgi:hypothetical protein